MNWKLFWTVFVALVSAGICLYVFMRWWVCEEKRRLIALLPERREIGFSAIIARNEVRGVCAAGVETSQLHFCCRRVQRSPIPVFPHGLLSGAAASCVARLCLGRGRGQEPAAGQMTGPLSANQRTHVESCLR